VRAQAAILAQTVKADQRADWCASDPNQILKYDAATGAVTLGDVEAYAYDRECLIRAAELGFPTAIEIVQKQDTFIFTVEATGALPPAEIVLNGACAVALLIAWPLRTCRLPHADVARGRRH
jgi:DNA-directed RNA polymerase II subunit RPB3